MSSDPPRETPVPFRLAAVGARWVVLVDGHFLIFIVAELSVQFRISFKLSSVFGNMS